MWWFEKAILDPHKTETYVSAELRARLAQSVEQLTFNQWVAGSIPAARTNLFNALTSISHLLDRAICDRDLKIMTGLDLAQKKWHAIIRPSTTLDRGAHENQVQLHPPPMAGLSIWFVGYCNIQPTACSN